MDNVETVTQGFLFRHKILKAVVFAVVAVVLEGAYDNKVYGPAITRYSKKHFPQGDPNGV